MAISKFILLALIGASTTSLVAAKVAKGDKHQHEILVEEKEDENLGGMITRIVGGDDADPGEYPYYAQMGGCGGTLIAPNVLLSAAHCNGDKGDNVIVGAYKRNNRWTDGAYSRKCKKWIAHPDYDSRYIAPDFALCLLDEPVELDTNVELNINFDSQVPKENSDLTAIGLGTLSYGGSIATTLQHVDVPYITNDECRTMYPSSWIRDNMICAGYEEGGKDSCQGDSGGPLVSIDERTGAHTLVGVVSFGIECAKKGYPGVYARVSSAEDWIKKVVCDDWESDAKICGTSAPTATPSESPSATPSASPTASPSVSPSAAPTASPSAAPSASPSASPSAAPIVTMAPTPEGYTYPPTKTPTAPPSSSPSAAPSASPTGAPSAGPTGVPSASPSASPTGAPSASPTAIPTHRPTHSPTSSCADDPSYKAKGKKTCRQLFVKKGNRSKWTKKWKKLCMKKEKDQHGNKSRIHLHCPLSCSEVGIGRCARR